MGSPIEDEVDDRAQLHGNVGGRGGTHGPEPICARHGQALGEGTQHLLGERVGGDAHGDRLLATRHYGRNTRSLV